jgi:hypothetical protein
MYRAGLGIAIALAACGGGSHQQPDGRPIDAPIDSSGGSNMARNDFEASPADHGLEVGTLATSAFVVVAPLQLRRRRKR